MKLSVEVELETDGRWVAEVPEIPGALGYGATRAEAECAAKSVAFFVLGRRLLQRENVDSVEFSSPA